MRSVWLCFKWLANMRGKLASTPYGGNGDYRVELLSVTAERDRLAAQSATLQTHQCRPTGWYPTWLLAAAALLGGLLTMTGAGLVLLVSGQQEKETASVTAETATALTPVSSLPSLGYRNGDKESLLIVRQSQEVPQTPFVPLVCEGFTIDLTVCEPVVNRPRFTGLGQDSVMPRVEPLR